MTPEERERLAIVETKIEAMEEDLKEIKEMCLKLTSVADRWRGGALVLMGLGGLVVWILDNLGSLKRFLIG